LKQDLKVTWWIVQGVPEDESKSGLVRFEFVDEYSNYSSLRKVCWLWYRIQAGREDLSPGSKLILWAIVERYRWETFSSHDSWIYYGKMVGLSRKSVGNSVKELIRQNVIWLALEEKNKLVEKAKPGQRKHILLVGLGKLLDEDLKREKKRKIPYLEGTRRKTTSRNGVQGKRKG